MVVQGLIALALALPTGMLFGVGYGTGVRIGYEQVYPLLFPKAKNSGSTPPNASDVATNLKNINKIYDTIGGKEASNMGIAMGLNSVRTSTENNPDFLYLEELESKLSGRTPSNLNPHNNSSTESFPPPELSNSDWLNSSLNPDSPNFDADYYIFVQKEKGNNAQTEATPEVKAELAEANLEFKKEIFVSPKDTRTPEMQAFHDWSLQANIIAQPYWDAISKIRTEELKLQKAIKKAGKVPARQSALNPLRLAFKNLIAKQPKIILDAKSKYFRWLRTEKRNQPNKFIRDEANRRFNKLVA